MYNTNVKQPGDDKFELAHLKQEWQKLQESKGPLNMGYMFYLEDGINRLEMKLNPSLAYTLHEPVRMLKPPKEKEEFYTNVKKSDAAK